jgi:uncharacterized protein with FMN-binding domain
VRARRVVAAVFAIALAVGAPTSITTSAHRTHSTAAVQASNHQPIVVVADGGYPGTFEPIT